MRNLRSTALLLAAALSVGATAAADILPLPPSTAGVLFERHYFGGPSGDLDFSQTLHRDGTLVIRDHWEIVLVTRVDRSVFGFFRSVLDASGFAAWNGFDASMGTENAIDVHLDAYGGRVHVSYTAVGLRLPYEIALVESVFDWLVGRAVEDALAGAGSGEIVDVAPVDEESAKPAPVDKGAGGGRTGKGGRNPYEDP